jgi:hypothetical protein
MIIDIRADLLHKRLRECQENYEFWRRWAAAQTPPRNPTHTLAALQQQIDELQAQLKELEPGR